MKIMGLLHLSVCLQVSIIGFAHGQGNNCKFTNYKTLLTLSKCDDLQGCWSQMYNQMQEDALLSEEELLLIMRTSTTGAKQLDDSGMQLLNFLGNATALVTYESEQKVSNDVNIYGKFQTDAENKKSNYSIVAVVRVKSGERKIVAGFNFHYSFEHQSGKSILWRSELKRLVYANEDNFLPIPNREKIIYTEGIIETLSNETLRTMANSIILANMSTIIGRNIKEFQYDTFLPENEEFSKVTGSFDVNMVSQATNASYNITGHFPKSGKGDFDVHLSGDFVIGDSGPSSEINITVQGYISLEQFGAYSSIIWPGIFMIIF